MTDINFYLASRSPRRRELLQNWGYRFIVLEARDNDPEVDETALPHESALDYVRRITRTKALWGQTLIKNRSLPSLPVLASDTTVAIDDLILGKPKDSDEAITFLNRLSGSSHQVYTGIAIVDSRGKLHEDLSISTVHFRKLTQNEINDYVATKEPLDKAGAYGIQGKAGSFVLSISGSFTGIMGLPMTETALLLRKIGIPLF